MAWVLPLLENLGQDKRVESILVPCLDAGSNPAISTKKNRRILVYLQKKQYLCTLVRDDGMWRSPVAQRSGGPEVASSNLVIPTKEKVTIL